MLKALFVEGRVVTGVHHGDAFSKLSEEEKDNRNLLSGFWDDQTGRFTTEDHFAFYTKKIILVRHSIIEKNADADPSLSPEGHRAADVTAHFLADTEDLSGYAGYTSPMLRCLETAEDIARLTGVPFTVDQSFVEAFPPPLDVPNRRDHFPGFRWDDQGEYHLPQETPRDFADRLDHAVRILPPKAVVVSHCTFIANLAELVSGDSRLHDTHPAIPAASVTLIDNYKIVYLGMQCKNEKIRP